MTRAWQGLGYPDFAGTPPAAASLRSTGARRSVQSHPGQGTVFSVELPVVSGGSALPDSPRDEVLSPSPVCTAAIPVIDDEPGIASALGHVLSRSGHAVATASNGRLALAQASGADV
jgi:hypothetical protein